MGGRPSPEWEKIIKEKFDMTEEEFWKLYHTKKKLGNRSLSRMLGCAALTIAKRLKSLGIKSLPPGGDQRTKKRRKAFNGVPPIEWGDE